MSNTGQPRDYRGRFASGDSAPAAHQAGVHAIKGTLEDKAARPRNQTVRERLQINNSVDARHFPDRFRK
jgi:hypothetical protein